MRLLDQQTMGRIFDVTDELGLSREEIEVPLAGEGEGAVELLENGKISITLPGADGDLDRFLASLSERIEASRTE